MRQRCHCCQDDAALARWILTTPGSEDRKSSSSGQTKARQMGCAIGPLSLLKKFQTKLDFLALRLGHLPEVGANHVPSGSLNCAWLHALNNTARNFRTRYVMEEGRRWLEFTKAARSVTERYLVDKHVDCVIKLVVRLSVVRASDKRGVE